jgi:hypothetical protein
MIYLMNKINCIILTESARSRARFSKRASLIHIAFYHTVLSSSSLSRTVKAADLRRVQPQGLCQAYS